MSFVSLHTHSQYSILDCTISIPALALKAKELGMKALALTDHGNMFGAVDFYKACKEHGIKAIIGCELWVAPTSRFEKKRVHAEPPGYPLVLLAKDKKGYQNLCKLSSLGYLEGFYYYPRIDKELLLKYSEGLVCLSGSTFSRISSLAAADDMTLLMEEVNWYRDLFKENYYFELHRHFMAEDRILADGMNSESWVRQNLLDYTEKQKKVIDRLLEISRKTGIKYVAANDAHYLERGDFKPHEILINIQSGEPCEIWERDSKGNPKTRVPNPKRQIYPSHEFYFKSPEEMQEIFADLPEALQNTVEIAESCKVEIDFKTRHYPVFIPPHLEGQTIEKETRLKEAEKFLYDLCQQGIPLRYSKERLQKVQEKYPKQDPLQVVRNRLDYEFQVLSSKGMCDYLLIVYDFIAWAKNRNIPVGPGRGSAAGSIIAYLIGITDIEPLRFHLFFERFINPERVSYPDIDVDICMDRRSEVIDYTIQKYGKDKVAQIITFGTMKAKMAIKDVGRVLSVPLAKVNAIAKLVPEDPNMTLDKALQLDPELKREYEADDEAKMIIDMAKKIEGSIRNTSIHAAGLIICESAITDHIPVCTAKDSEMIVTQFAMKPVEAVGMLKIDFLGLKTLTSIQKASESVYRNTGKKIDCSNLSLEDKATFELLNQGKTLGVFQLESAGMQELAKHLHIDNFEEIIAVGALYRPGPMDMIPSFIARKHGREAIEIDHPLLKEILAETYGVMVYQEQVMQIASKLAGYSLGEGDVLRRAMGKKDKEEMARQREKFLRGALANQIDEKTAATIFDKIEKFASYGFNKSHAAAYAYLSYVTAYLKANHPREWMAALMTCDNDDLTKVAKFISEAKALGIRILPPDVNESGREFGATKEAIRFAISGIKGIGSAVVDAIIAEREARGYFESLYDFIKRIDTTKVSKKNIELLISAGAFDFTTWPRDAMRESVDAMYEQASQDQKEESQGIMNLFSLLQDEKKKEFAFPPQVKIKSSRLDMLNLEKELLGFYLTGHPMDNFQGMLRRLSCVPLKDLDSYPGDLFRTAFIVDAVEFKISAKSQKKFAVLTISDGMERFELPIWSEMYEEKVTLLHENKLLFAILHMERKDETIKLTCKYLEDLSKMDEAQTKRVEEHYDTLKAQQKSADFRKKKESTAAPKEEKKKEPVRMVLSFDADAMRHSHVLDLKNLFRKNPGKTRLEIHFKAKHGHLGSLSIDSSWGVGVTAELLQSIKSETYFIDLKLED